MNVFTHKKRPYKALCVQLSAATERAMITALTVSGARVEKVGAQLVLRWRPVTRDNLAVQVMNEGDWLRVGENGDVKIMTNEVFNERYEAIE